MTHAPVTLSLCALQVIDTLSDSSVVCTSYPLSLLPECGMLLLSPGVFELPSLSLLPRKRVLLLSPGAFKLSSLSPLPRNGGLQLVLPAGGNSGRRSPKQDSRAAFFPSDSLGERDGDAGLEWDEDAAFFWAFASNLLVLGEQSRCASDITAMGGGEIDRGTAMGGGEID
eukprot:gnl/MRDRNA2_/MRDRNA2_23103_c0_seq1.p2 gnl/MRDRNA2_/MRDRNA2_23103_c0~~gnl/MRDRNA2_/MRDRNA2_23103_c0_seq1.p2  ORF type:complete len:170 (-),score=25.18 gnl/MRDRNA2_/MRDRNA2_23103_c0_seq1:284-793(-)